METQITPKNLTPKKIKLRLHREARCFDFKFTTFHMMVTRFLYIVYKDYSVYNAQDADNVHTVKNCIKYIVCRDIVKQVTHSG